MFCKTQVILIYFHFSIFSNELCLYPPFKPWAGATFWGAPHSKVLGTYHRAVACWALGGGVDLSHPGWLSSERETTLGAPFKHSPPTPSWGCLLHNSLLLWTACTDLGASTPRPEAWSSQSLVCESGAQGPRTWWSPRLYKPFWASVGHAGQEAEGVRALWESTAGSWW